MYGKTQHFLNINYFQILNNQYGGDIDYKNINNEKIKMKCYSNINYLLKKTKGNYTGKQFHNGKHKHDKTKIVSTVGNSKGVPS